MGSIYFDCPFCSYGKSVPEKYQGKKIKCPRCLATLTLGAPQPMDLTSLPLPQDDESPVNQTAIEIETSEILMECPFCFKIVETEDSQCPHCGKSLKKECPLCSELIDAAAIHCPKCKRELSEKMKESTDESKVLPYVQAQVFYLGAAALVCGLGLVLGPVAVISGLKRRTPDMEQSVRDTLNGAIAMGAAGFVGSLVFLLLLI